MPELVIRVILKAMEYIPDFREDRRRNKAKKRNKYCKNKPKREIKARSVTGNRSGRMKDFRCLKI